MRVLIVDDHRFFRQALRLLLRKHVLMDEAAGVEEAMTCLESERYGIVVTDERMTDGSGRELLERIRERGLACRRVLMSAFDIPADDDPAYERFFEKPDALRDLVHWIKGAALASKGLPDPH